MVTVQSNTLENAIEVKNELIINSLSRDYSYPSGTFEIRGSGLNIDSRLKRVYIGDNLVSPISVDINSMHISIPLDADGNVLSKSNSLPLTIAASETVIRVCDSGNLKDDNFKLIKE